MLLRSTMFPDTGREFLGFYSRSRRINSGVDAVERVALEFRSATAHDVKYANLGSELHVELQSCQRYIPEQKPESGEPEELTYLWVSSTVRRVFFNSEGGSKGSLGFRSA